MRFTFVAVALATAIGAFALDPTPPSTNAATDTIPDFDDLDVRLAYSFRVMSRIDIVVTAGVTNIFSSYQNDFDRGYLRDSGYIYGPSTPRSLTCSLTISLF